MKSSATAAESERSGFDKGQCKVIRFSVLCEGAGWLGKEGEGGSCYLQLTEWKLKSYGGSKGGWILHWKGKGSLIFIQF